MKMLSDISWSKATLNSVRYSSGVQRLNYILIFLIAVITCLKLGLIGKGFLAFPDEFIYRSSERAFQNLADGNLKAAVNEIFATQGRPGEALVKIIPCMLQVLTSKVFNLNYAENSYPMFLFNFIVSCCILIIHYKFSRIVLRTEFLALLSVLIYTCLSNSYIYMRHVMPYDTSLLIFYFVLYRIVKNINSNDLTLFSSFVLGLFAFFGLIVYPGYFPLLITAVLVLFLYNLSKDNIMNRFYNSALFTSGSIYCLVLVEFFSNAVGRSYIGDSATLSKSIIQGSFEESYSFIIKYFFQVEGFAGILLITGIVVFCFVAVVKIRKGEANKNSLLFLLFGILFCLYMLYAGVGYFLHGFVLYGRLLHQYYPFICILSVWTFYELIVRSVKKTELILFSLSFVFIITFVINFFRYNSFAYPRDLAFEYSKKCDFKNKELVFEYGTSVPALPSEEELSYSEMTVEKSSKRITLVNFCFFYPVEDLSKYHEFVPEKNYSLIDSRSFFMNNKAYQFEGLKIQERENVSKMNLQIKVYSN